MLLSFFKVYFWSWQASHMFIITVIVSEAFIGAGVRGIHVDYLQSPLNGYQGALASTTASQRKRQFETAFAFFQTLSSLIQSAENIKFRRISLELVFWRLHSSLEREKKIRRGLFTSSIKREIRHFHVVVVQ